MTGDTAQTISKTVRLLGMALLLAGCGATTDPPTTKTAPQPAAEATTTSSTSTTITMMMTTTSTAQSTTLASTTTTPLGLLPEGDPVAGEELFMMPMAVRFNDACSTCHSEAGAGRGWGPVLTGIGDLAGERVPGLPAEHYLQQSITSPNTFVLDGWAGHMPDNYGDILSDQELADLVAFLLQQ